MDTQNDGPWKRWLPLNMAIFGIYVRLLGVYHNHHYHIPNTKKLVDHDITCAPKNDQKTELRATKECAGVAGMVWDSNSSLIFSNGWSTYPR